MSRDDTFVGSKVLPGGGVAGDVLTKLSSADGDAGWSPVTIPPPVAGDVINNIVNQTNYIYNGVLWVPPPGSRGNLRMVFARDPGSNVFDGVGLSIAGTRGALGFSVPTTTSYQASQFRLTRAQAGVVNTSAGFAFQINTILWRGNAAGRGGFSAVIEFSWNVFNLAHRFFGGVSATLDPCLGAEPSAALNTFGLGWDSTDPNFFHLLHNDAAGAATKTVTPIVPVPAVYYYLAVGCAGGGAGLGLTLYSKDSNGLTVLFSTAAPVVANVPATTTFLAPGFIDNTAATVAGSTVCPHFITLDPA